MEILEKGTKVLIFDHEGQIDGNYIVGTIDNVYYPRNFINNKKILLPDLVLYEVVDTEGKLHRGHYFRKFMTPEDYKKCLLAQIEDNCSQIKDLTEENSRLNNLLLQIDKDIIKNQSNQRILEQ